MPVYIPKRKVRTTCKNCGKDFTFQSGGYGDNVNFNTFESLNRLRDLKRAREGIKCPHCGYKNRIEKEE